MEKYIGSDVEKAKGRLYFNTKAEYGRNGDIIVIWFMRTPKGRFSKFYHVKRWNGTKYKFIIFNKRRFIKYYSLRENSEF